MILRNSSEGIFHTQAIIVSVNMLIFIIQVKTTYPYSTHSEVHIIHNNVEKDLTESLDKLASCLYSVERREREHKLKEVPLSCEGIGK